MLFTWLGWKSLKNLYKILTKLWWETTSSSLASAKLKLCLKDSKSVMEKLSKWAILLWTLRSEISWEFWNSGPYNPRYIANTSVMRSPGLHHLPPYPMDPEEWGQINWGKSLSLITKTRGLQPTHIISYMALWTSWQWVPWTQTFVISCFTEDFLSIP